MNQNSEPVVLRDESDELRAPKPAGPEWRRAFLACLAFVVPLYWVSHFLLDVLPALVCVLVFGEHLQFFHLSIFGGMVAGVPGGAAVMLTPPAGARTGHSLPGASPPCRWFSVGIGKGIGRGASAARGRAEPSPTVRKAPGFPRAPSPARPRRGTLALRERVGVRGKELAENSSGAGAPESR
jgi:hypothetical protein